jgi:hypothetical protein
MLKKKNISALEQLWNLGNALSDDDASIRCDDAEGSSESRSVFSRGPKVIKNNSDFSDPALLQVQAEKESKSALWRIQNRLRSKQD